MRVLILGANGRAGNAAARAFSQAGHLVTGCIRNEKQARALQVSEIQPYLIDAAKIDTWRHLVQEADVVVDAVGTEQLGNLIFDTVHDEALKCRPDGPPLQFLYTSGHGVHEMHPIRVSSDRSPCENQIESRAWRLSLERKILVGHSISLLVHILRAPIIWHPSSMFFHLIFKAAADGKLQYPVAARNARIPLVHYEDLGRAYALVASKGFLLPSMAFDIANPFPEAPLEAWLTKLARLANAKLVWTDAINEQNAQASSAGVNLQPILARDLLGWQPNKPPLLDGLEMYFRAWQVYDR